MHRLKALFARIIRLFKGREYTIRWFGRRYRVLSIERYEASSDRPPPLRWVPCHPSTLSKFKATMTCSAGHRMTLRGHSIAPDGSVTPSVVCPARECSFHAFVRLAGWTSGDVKDIMHT